MGRIVISKEVRVGRTPNSHERSIRQEKRFHAFITITFYGGIFYIIKFGNNSDILFIHKNMGFEQNREPRIIIGTRLQE